MATIPVPVTQLPMPVPSTQDPANFDVRADAFLGALPLWGDQLNALGTVTYNNAAISESSANAAAASQNAAANSASAAAASQNAAANSASAAAASQNAAAASQNAAANSASAAAASQNAAAASQSDALASKNAAKASELLALQYRNEAEYIARGGFVGNSTTSVSISIDPKTITIETQKGFVPGQYVIVSSKANYNNRFGGYILSYNPANGQMTIQVDSFNGGGIYTDWTVGISLASGSAGRLQTTLVSTDTTVASGVFYVITTAVNLFLPTGYDTPGFTFGWSCTQGGFNDNNYGIVHWNTAKVKGKTGGIMYMYDPRDTAIVTYTGNASVGFVQI